MRKLSMKRKSKVNESSADSDQDEDKSLSEYLNQKQDLKKDRKKRKSKNASSEDSNIENDSNNQSKNSNKKGRKSTNESNGTKVEENEEEYEVEAVQDEKMVNNTKHYLIRWKGYGQESDTWEPESTLDCPELIAKFVASQKSDNKKIKKRTSSVKKPTKKAKTDDSDEEETQGEYEVDRILEVHFKKNGQREFLVHWKGFSANNNTWEPEENMNCPELIEKFMEKVNKARDTEQRVLRVDRKPTKIFTLTMVQKGRRCSRRNLDKQRVQYKEID